MLLILVAVLPFYLNDFAYHFLQLSSYASFENYIAITYATDLFAIVIICLSLMKHFFNREECGLISLPFRCLLISSVLLSAVGIAIDRLAGPLIYQHFHEWSYHQFPAYPDEVWRWTDLIIGIPLVAVAEEVIFRGLLLTFLRERFSILIAAVFSMLIFSGIHWGVGPHSLINSFLYAIGPTWFAIRYRSLYPAIIAHFVTDFVAFYLY
jgi:membrane protease YdiL (CAAX protease family)